MMTERRLLVVCCNGMCASDHPRSGSLIAVNTLQSSHKIKACGAFDPPFTGNLIRTLAQIRKMAPAVQINIADKQVNTAS